MRKYLATWINDAVLARLDGQFEGVISGGTERTVRNPFTAQREIQPVIQFDDGHQWIPNITARRALIQLFGPQTEDWIGRRLTISRRRVDRVNHSTGATSERWQKVVSCSDVQARVIQYPAAAERADCDDSEDTLRQARVEPLTADDIWPIGKRRAQ